MSASELERLLWDRLDGTLTAADADRLTRLMATEEGAEELAPEIEKLAVQLDEIEPQPVPDGLSGDILAAVAELRAPSGKTTVSWLEKLRRFARPPVTRRLAYLAAALLVAVVGYQLITNDQAAETGTFSGTAGVPRETDTPLVRHEIPGDLGTLTLEGLGDLVRLQMEIDPGIDAARLELRGAGLAVEESGGTSFSLAPLDGGLALEIVGTGSLWLTLRAEPPASVAVKLMAADETVFETQWTAKDVQDEEPATNFLPDER